MDGLTANKRGSLKNFKSKKWEANWRRITNKVELLKIGRKVFQIQMNFEFTFGHLLILEACLGFPFSLFQHNRPRVVSSFFVECIVWTVTKRPLFRSPAPTKGSFFTQIITVYDVVHLFLLRTNTQVVTVFRSGEEKLIVVGFHYQVAGGTEKRGKWGEVKPILSW